MEALFGLPGMDMARSIPGMGTLLAQPLSGDLALIQFNIAWKGLLKASCDALLLNS